MKRIISAVLAATAVLMLTEPNSQTFAEDDYQPSYYFKPFETEAAQIILNGTVYVNSSLFTGENNSLDAEVYIDDDQKQTGHVIVKWKCDSEYIALDNLKDPITLCGKSPYADFTTSKSIGVTAHPELNKHFVSYSLGLHAEPFVLTGENSDDYPLAGFSAVFSDDIPAGKYAVEFMSGESGAQCEILYKYGDTTCKEFFPTGNYAKPINIHVSDRMLGDIDDNGIISGSDATLALREYTLLSSGMTGNFNDAQKMACDINGDGIISGSDANMLLRYYTALSSGEKLSIYDYFLK